MRLCYPVPSYAWVFHFLDWKIPGPFQASPFPSVGHLNISQIVLCGSFLSITLHWPLGHGLLGILLLPCLEALLAPTGLFPLALKQLPRSALLSRMTPQEQECSCHSCSNRLSPIFLPFCKILTIHRDTTKYRKIVPLPATRATGALSWGKTAKNIHVLI